MKFNYFKNIFWLFLDSFGKAIIKYTFHWLLLKFQNVFLQIIWNFLYVFHFKDREINNSVEDIPLIIRWINENQGFSLIAGNK